MHARKQRPSGFTVPILPHWKKAACHQAAAIRRIECAPAEKKRSHGDVFLGWCALGEPRQADALALVPKHQHPAVVSVARAATVGVAEEVRREPANHGRKGNQRDEVRDRHETVEAVSELPNHVEVGHAARKDHGDVGNLVDAHRRALGAALAEEVLDALLAVVVPRDERGKRKEHEPHGHDVLAAGDALPKGRRAHGALGHHGVGVPQPRGDDHEARDRAHDDGVEEHLERAPQALAGGVVGVGGGMRDGRRAHARLVGEHAARHAHAARVHDRGTQEAARGGRTREGVAEDLGDRGGNLAGVHDEHRRSTEEVENGREGHKLLGDLRDAGDAADEDQSREKRHDGADDGQRHAEGGVHAAGERVGLHARADAEGRQEAEGGEQHGEPGLAQAAGDVVHGAAHDLAALVARAVCHRQRDLAELDDHAGQRGEPQPEDRARAARGHRKRHAHDVAGAERCRERGAHRLEGRDGALPRLGRVGALEECLGGVAHDHVEAREHDAAGDDEQEHAGPEHQHDHGDAPQHVVVQGGDGGHKEVKHEGPLDGARAVSATQRVTLPYPCFRSVTGALIVGLRLKRRVLLGCKIILRRIILGRIILSSTLR